MLVTHIECTADGLGIQVFGDALLNYPRLKKYAGAQLLPVCLKHNDRLHTYTNWRVNASAETVEGFVGIRVGPPSNPPDLSQSCGDTIGCIGYTAVRMMLTRSAAAISRLADLS